MMAITYATYEDFTACYSAGGVSQAQINSHWLPYGSLRVNEGLGGFFTIPFSSNNDTAKSLTIQFAFLGILQRTRNQGDSGELLEEVTSRLEDIRAGHLPMILTDGTALYAQATGAPTLAWSSTQDYKPTFDMRDAECQRIDPDLLSDLRLADY